MTRDIFERFQQPQRGRFGDNEHAQRRSNRPTADARSDVIDVDVVIHYGTPKALLVSIDGDYKKAVWLQRSMIEVEHKPATVRGTNRDGRKVDLAVAVVTLTERMAREKGLI